MGGRPRRTGPPGVTPGLPPGAGAEAPGRDLALAASAVAGRFAAGATLWSVSPRWPAHARHVAVEFVHPVVVGTRALPAVHVDDPDVLGALRPAARAVDVLVALSGADDGTVTTLMRYARAWGLLTVWVGAGAARPEPGAADHVLWSGEGWDAAVFGGGVVLLYHLLWELAQVCLEHLGPAAPGTPAGSPAACVTCSDEGRVGEVVAVGPDSRASVRTAAGLEDVDATLIEARLGGLVLVHAGAAVAVVGEAPA